MSAVNPEHYQGFSNGAQPVDIAEHLSFNLGNALKYISRAGRKGDAVEDLSKARWYIDRELNRLESNNA
ncbi:DUF3310 domain-containing protein [Corynebacterium kefirresidentii]|uniref:DUF3310 domain-containing protein n=1 Tax=Corynebacterium sp. CTNIH14 TaxID=3230065 RepID=UPI002934F8C0|nr:DUF3310 domain-containing protein [Corynebacterium kefirresidentii]MDV2415941.1 DUF3310 domain-containing protein [Corynebacterium kefirresidentii]